MSQSHELVAIPYATCSTCGGDCYPCACVTPRLRPLSDAVVAKHELLEVLNAHRRGEVPSAYLWDAVTAAGEGTYEQALATLWGWLRDPDLADGAEATRDLMCTLENFAAAIF